MIKISNISKNYKNKAVLKDVSLSIDKGQLVVIIGKSGCGKTTLLKMINRLIEPSSGSIFINGENIKSVNEVKLRRNIGYVIQQTGLFPHMTIKENIELIPTLQNLDTDTITQNTYKLMKMVGMDNDVLDRYPTELSGGQQQRIGVARAFATDPEIILMDEPFSALDPITRSDLQDELVRLQCQLKKTIVFVTHDMDEAIKIANKICIMKDGQIIQYDTPENILKNPVNEFVSSFVGKNRIWSSPEFIKISDIMMEHPITASQELSILSCIEKMRISRVDSLLIVDRRKTLLGIVKASRLRGVVDRAQTVGSFMSNNFPILSPDHNILDALKLIGDNKISTVPVVDNNRCLVGLITRSSLVTTLSHQYFDYTAEEG